MHGREGGQGTRVPSTLTHPSSPSDALYSRVRTDDPAQDDSEGAFLREAVSEQTVVIDPRASLRVSRSVGHLLQQQIREALRMGAGGNSDTGDGGAAAIATGDTGDTPARDTVTPPAGSGSGGGEASVTMTPRACGFDTTTESSILSPNTRAGRSNLGIPSGVHPWI